MTWTDAAVALLAGLWGGTINTVVGSGTLVTFPLLLAIGLPPVTANATNTVGLFPGSLTGAYGYRAELVGQRRRILVLGSASAVGAVVGAVLLLTLPASAFEAVVPVLIALALVLVVAGPRLTAWVRARNPDRDRTPGRGTSVAVVAVAGLGAVYGGYFGAAQGVLIIGFLGLLLTDGIQRLNALKNLLVGTTNLVAAVVFAFTADVRWGIAGLVAVGAILGGVLGARIGRRLPPALLRGCIVVIGLVALVVLLTR